MSNPQPTLPNHARSVNRIMETRAERERRLSLLPENERLIALKTEFNIILEICVDLLDRNRYAIQDREVRFKIVLLIVNAAMSFACLGQRGTPSIIGVTELLEECDDSLGWVLNEIQDLREEEERQREEEERQREAQGEAQGGEGVLGQVEGQVDEQAEGQVDEQAEGQAERQGEE